MGIPEPELAEDTRLGAIGEAVRLVHEWTEASEAAILANILAGAGAAVAGGIQDGESGKTGPWVEIEGPLDKQPTLFNVLTVGPTAEGRKGTATNFVKALLEEVDPAWVRTGKRIRNGFPNSGPALVSRLYKLAQQEAMRRLTKAQEDAKALLEEEETGGRSFTVKEKSDLAELLELTADDVAPVSHFNGVFVTEEFVSVMKTCRQDQDYSELIRILWQGSNVANETKKDGLIEVVCPRICVIGHISAEEFNASRTDKEMRGGTYNRFLYFWTYSEKEWPFGAQVPAENWAKAVEILRAGINYGRKQGRINWDQEARNLWADPKTGDGLYRELRRMGKGKSRIAAFCGRSTAYVRRLAALSAIMNLRNVVTSTDLRFARAIFQYSLDSVRYILGDSADEEIELEEDENEPIEGNVSDADVEYASRFARYLSGLGSWGSNVTTLSRSCRPTYAIKGRQVSASKGFEDAATYINECAGDDGPWVIKRKEQASSKGGKGGRMALVYKWVGPPAEQATPLILGEEAVKASPKPTKATKKAPQPPKPVASAEKPSKPPRIVKATPIPPPRPAGAVKGSRPVKGSGRASSHDPFA